MLRKMLLPTVLVANLALLAACSEMGWSEPEAEFSNGAASSATESADAASDSGGSSEAASGSEASAPDTNPEQPFEEGGNIEVPTAMVVEAMDAGTKILFLDARDTLNFEAGHIPGSVNVPFFEAEKHLDKVPNDDTWLITYCACPTAEAKQLADTLMNNGYTKVKVLQEGLDGWTDLGRELDTGAPSS